MSTAKDYKIKIDGSANEGDWHKGSTPPDEDEDERDVETHLANGRSTAPL